jgi:hypothetical protein
MAEGVGDDRNADPWATNSILGFLDNTHGETGCDAFFGCGINAFRPELPRELNKRLSGEIAEGQHDFRGVHG